MRLPRRRLQVRQGIEAQLRSPLHAYHARVRTLNYAGCFFFEPISLEELDKVTARARRGAGLRGRSSSHPPQGHGRAHAMAVRCVRSALLRAAAVALSPPSACTHEASPRPPARPPACAHTRLAPPPPRAAQVDLAASLAHHVASFSSPAEFTLVLTGAVKLGALLPLATAFLATIPPAPGRGAGARRDCRTLTPLPFAFPDAPVVEDVEVGRRRRRPAHNAAARAAAAHTQSCQRRGGACALALACKARPCSSARTRWQTQSHVIAAQSRHARCFCCACAQVDMVSPMTQSQITLPVGLDREQAREQVCTPMTHLHAPSRAPSTVQVNARTSAHAHPAPTRCCCRAAVRSCGG